MWQNCRSGGKRALQTCCPARLDLANLLHPQQAGLDAGGEKLREPGHLGGILYLCHPRPWRTASSQPSQPLLGSSARKPRARGWQSQMTTRAETKRRGLCEAQHEAQDRHEASEMLATAVNRNNSSTLPDALGTLSLSLFSPTNPCQESRENDAWTSNKVCPTAPVPLWQHAG